MTCKQIPSPLRIQLLSDHLRLQLQKAYLIELIFNLLTTAYQSQHLQIEKDCFLRVQYVLTIWFPEIRQWF